MTNSIWRCIAGVILLSAHASALAVCGAPLGDNAFGRPLDYTNPQDTVTPQQDCVAGCLNLVHNFHFNRDVETLKAGMTGDLPGDIQYVLVVFPNHYRALNAMARWQLQNPEQAAAQRARQPGRFEFALYSVDCYYERAMAVGPEDPMLRYLYGIYLHQKKDLDGALASYQKAIELGGDSAELHYNLGLLYVDLRDYEAAKLHAEKAYAMGAPLPGLRNKMQRLGKW